MSTSPFSVAVLISAGRHPVSGIARACRGDAVAMALGKKLADDRLRVVHAGKADDPSLADYLALGANRIDVISVPEGCDPIQQMVSHLAACDVVLTGVMGEQGMGSGLLPYALAHALHRPIVANVIDVVINKNELNIRQFLPKGKRRGLAAQGPVILAVHPLAAAELNYAYARRLVGRIVVEQPTLVPQPDARSPWMIAPDIRRPVRLKAHETKGGLARLQSAIASEAKGGIVAFDGSPVDKAQIVFNYMREHRLIDF
jgi:electron transfer flavoprotein beta subunit